MTRSTRKSKPPKTAPRADVNATSASPVPRWAILLIAVLAALPFVAGKYIEFGTPGPFDSAAYVHSARRVLDGAQIGVDEKPGAQVGTLLVNMLGVALFGFSETGPQVIQALLQAAALVLMFLALRRALGSPLAAGAGVIVAATYLSAPLVAKFGNVKEQYLVAFMVLGMSCFLIRLTGGRWWWALLAGATAVWAPLFKQTGTSAMAAIGLFAIAQPLFSDKTWKRAGTDVLLLLAGGAASLAPVVVWLAVHGAPGGYFPFVSILLFLLPASGKATGGYVTKSRQLIPFAEQAARNLRYYWALAVPVLLAIGALLTAVVRAVIRLIRRGEMAKPRSYESLILPLGLWWVLDMSFVWISPRSYEQYFIPLTASGAALGAWLVAQFLDARRSSRRPRLWDSLGVIILVVLVAQAWPIFFGFSHSPHSGSKYPEKRRGYLQRIDEVAEQQDREQATAWQAVGQHIRERTQPDDRIYVWGWYPGIYVEAGRMSCAPAAVTSEMHVRSPEQLAKMVAEILDSFREHRPKFIVDSRKLHFPWDRPPLELWPLIRGKPLPPDPAVVGRYERQYANLLAERIDPAEAERFKTMKPLRDYIREHYKVVGVLGPHVVFQRKAG